MTKQITHTVLEDIKWRLDGANLLKIKEEIEHLISEYGPDATLDIGEDYADCYSETKYAYVKVMGFREESDEVYNQRLAREAQRLEQEKARNKAEYERLKKLFKE